MDQGASQPLDLRRLTYFVAVAEELHFGRAAERLYIAQPVLSRAVRQLEQEVGATLLQRDSRNVTLTPAGRQLYEDARVLLLTADAARRRVSDMRDGPRLLTVGFFFGDPVAPAARAFHARRPGVEIALLRVYWHDQVAVLHDGRADISFVHLPIDADGLTIMPVRQEPRMAVLSVEHPCADQEALSIADLADDPVVGQRGAPAVWESFHNVDPRPDGSRPRLGPAVDNIEEKFEHVAAGGTIAFVPASAAAAYSHPAVVCRPVHDIAPLQVALAWPSANDGGLVADFAACVRGAG